MLKTLFEINPKLDRERLAAEFKPQGRLQIRDVLTDEASAAVAHVLQQETPWGLAWQAGQDGPNVIRQSALQGSSTQSELARVNALLQKAMSGPDYGFAYAVYPMLDAYLQKWREGSPQDLLLEYINTPEMLELVREVTGIEDVIKADAQATIFAPGHFLAQHDDGGEIKEGRRIAYVFNFCPVEWRVDWGGYLNFFNDDGDIIAGFKPRFNALNLFRVPQKHNVSLVAPFAPLARYAITGWFRDR